MTTDNNVLNYDQFLLYKSDFEDVKDIGNGRFGETALIKSKEPIGEKSLFVKRTIVSTDGKVPDQKHFLKEIEFFFTVRPHPCFTKFYGFLLEPSAIVVEYCKNGSLQMIWDLCKRKRAPAGWNNTARAKAVFGIAAALQHLHSYGAIHRYLSLTNVLVDDNFEVRLSDFGFAKMPYDATRMSEIASKPIYTAPEALVSTDYDETVDVYAYSIVAYQLLTGREPYDIKKASSFAFNDSVLKGLRPSLPDDMDHEIAKVLQFCWDQDPEKRPTFLDILRFFHTYTKPLLPDVDQSAYVSYIESILSSTNIKEEDKDFFFSPKITEDKINLFNECLARAQKTGEAEDLYQVGRLYDIGYGVVANSYEAFDYLSQAAEKGHPMSMYYVSLYLKTGRGTDVDLEKSNELIIKASDLGYSLASLEYGKRLRDGTGFDHPRPKDALEKFKELADPPNEIKEAMFEYGILLIRPPEVPRGSDQKITANTKEGIKYLLESSEKGYIPAQMYYAKALIDGTGVDKNVDEAIKIYQRAATQNVPVALNNLGNCYEEAKLGFPKDLKKAAQYYRKAAELGFPDAMSRYAILLNRGDAGEKDIITAAHYFQKAADLGVRAACHNYASFLQNGTANVMQNIPKAIEYYDKAGYALSYYRIGDIYLQGIGGVDRDIDEAIVYFQKSAKLGNKQAEAKLKELTE